ncbi:MAG TPA: PorV/PorQ family protein [bacterium]|nr:PorV/PorQ family protein [bacterium]
MKNKRKIVLCGLIFGAAVQFVAAQDYKKLAQTGFQFLSVNSDGRASALAGAVTATEMGSAALFFNPATMGGMTGLIDATASINEFIADIRHNTFSLALSPLRGEYGVIGFSVQTVDYGELQGTRVAANDKGFVDTEIMTPTALAIGVGYAKRLTDRFTVGGQIKYTHQNLHESFVVASRVTPDSLETGTVENELSPLAYDFGTLFKTGFKSLAFGMSVRNFSREIKYAEEGFQLPLVFQLGIAMDLFDLWKPGVIDHSLVMSVDATHYRSHPEQILVGLDYRVMDFLSFRGGYVSNNDEDGLTFGFGVCYMGLSLDYAYTPFGVFDRVQRMTARFSM